MQHNICTGQAYAGAQMIEHPLHPQAQCRIIGRHWRMDRAQGPSQFCMQPPARWKAQDCGLQPMGLRTLWAVQQAQIGLHQPAQRDQRLITIQRDHHAIGPAQPTGHPCISPIAPKVAQHKVVQFAHRIAHGRKLCVHGRGARGNQPVAQRHLAAKGRIPDQPWLCGL